MFRTDFISRPHFRRLRDLGIDVQLTGFLKAGHRAYSETISPTIGDIDIACGEVIGMIWGSTVGFCLHSYVICNP